MRSDIDATFDLSVVGGLDRSLPKIGTHSPVMRTRLCAMNICMRWRPKIA